MHTYGQSFFENPDNPNCKKRINCLKSELLYCELNVANCFYLSGMPGFLGIQGNSYAGR